MKMFLEWYKYGTAVIVLRCSIYGEAPSLKGWGAPAETDNLNKSKHDLQSEINMRLVILLIKPKISAVR